ncbi:MAG: response regulator transcription factor [Candidatus Nitrohelix vancouverensis]|uniref:Response regulator transcription factor n=1 Tax=Candidatus Nitrohelix vancouverensis TaxID=2705534 RepID=A0A7T0C4S4_9BACT|nr:MAG: response regulator transcription factor [Candidatus Nitrohelix vancouverensis]
MSRKIKILIADDHAVVRRGLTQIISEASDFELVGIAEDGVEALSKAQELEIDVLLLDYDMPGKNGLDVLAQVKSIKPRLSVIILSIFPEEHYGARFLKAGASGYLGKSAAPEQLVEAVRKVAGGGTYIGSALADKLVFELKGEKEGAPHERLTDREFQVFYRIATGKKLKDIADELAISINTVSTYRSRVLDKLDLKSNADLIHYALRNHLIGG